MSLTTVRIQSSGRITLPAGLRRRYGLKESDVLTLTDLGEGSLLLHPGVSQGARFGGRLAQRMAEEEASLEEMLEPWVKSGRAIAVSTTIQPDLLKRKQK